MIDVVLIKDKQKKIQIFPIISSTIQFKTAYVFLFKKT